MPLVPEARKARQDVKASISSQFWEQPVHSTKSLDGQLWSLPAEPPALSLTGSSGLSRTQQLVAAQAARLPFFPSYDGSSDGLVLDRVLAKAGGQRWWAALSGRIRAQRIHKQTSSGDRGKVEAVRDLSNYALCARGRFQLGSRLTLNGVVEAPDADRLQQRFAQKWCEYRESKALPGGAAVTSSAAGDGPVAEAAATAGSGGGAAPALPVEVGRPLAASRQLLPPPPPELEPCTAHATLRCALPGHDLSATAGYNLHYVDSAGDAAHVPLAVSLDFASHDRQDGLQYRVGLHQVTAPPTEMPARPGSLPQRWRTSLHAQGALAVEGEAYIWRGGSTSKDAGKDSSSKEAGVTNGGSTGGAAQPAPDAAPAAGVSPTAGTPKQPVKGSGSGAGGGDEGGAAGGSTGAADEPQRSRLASALASAAAAEEDAVPPRKQGAGRGRQEPSSGISSQAEEPAAGQAAAAEPGREGQAAGLQAPAAAAAAAAGGAAGVAAQAGTTLGPAQDAGSPAAAAAGSGGVVGVPQAQAQPAAPTKLEQFIRPLEQLGEQMSGMLHQVTHPPGPQQDGQQPAGSGGDGGSSGTGAGQQEAARVQQEEQRGQLAAGTSSSKPSNSQAGSGGGGEGGASGSGSGSSRVGPHLPSLLSGLSSQSITSTIHDSVALLQQVKESVERLTSNVQDGSLQRLSQQLVDTRAAPQRRRPYSMLLAQPHLKLNAALGCLARMPLPPLRTFSFPHASYDPLDQAHHNPAAGSSASAGPAGGPIRHASTSSLVSRASHSSQLAEAWQPYLKGTTLRVFASAGVSGQLGRFARPFLDYTAASARVDIGLTSPHVVGVVPDASALVAAAAEGGHRPDKHRAFALEGRGAWHALSVSLAQQVFGPVRARVDARFALDPTSVPASEGERSTLKGVLQTALSVRPSLLEAAYGFDCVLPGTEGAARLAVWVSPKRREAMAELRLF